MIPKIITVHCSDTENGKHVDVSTLRRDHIENRNFTDIGYHFIVNPNGEIDRGRTIYTVGAHVQGHNKDNVGICLIGDDKFTKKQLVAMKEYIYFLCVTHSIKFKNVYCHNEFDTAKAQGKTCPNFSGEKLRLFLEEEDLEILMDNIYEG